MRKATSAVLLAPQQIELREFPIPAIDDDSFLLRVNLVSICGGDPIEYAGRNPKAHYPMILGHEMVGTIADIGDAAARHYGVDVGDRVAVEPYLVCGACEYCLNGAYQFCARGRVYGVSIGCSEPPHLWGAYGQYLYGARGARVHKIAPGVPDEAAVLSSVLGNGVRWIRTKAQVKFGESVVVLGVGAQGLATIVAAREAGADPLIVVGREANQRKWSLARAFGATHLIDLDAVGQPVEELRRITGGRLADGVVECTGAEALMQLGLEMARPLGRYVMIGTCGFAPRALQTDLVVFKELQILGGLGQSWDTEAAVRLINARRAPLEQMVTHVFPLEQAHEALRFFIEHPDTTVRVAIRPEDG
jgi:threonine dehydrogenase-like Zn-dependent dehydrogenase